jgi:hypothetical protein
LERNNLLIEPSRAINESKQIRMRKRKRKKKGGGGGSTLIVTGRRAKKEIHTP